MKQSDSFQRFLFERLGIRGEIVHLRDSWIAVQERHAYPPLIRDHLGQALAAVSLLSGMIKFQGSLILQAQSQGPLTTVVAQATSSRTVRGLAKWRELPASASLGDLYGEGGRLVLTIQNEGSEPYQGIVGLQGEQLSDAIEAYFGQSEQLKTRLWLVANSDHAAGLLLQELPGAGVREEDWERLDILASTVTQGELIGLKAEDLLYRLFHEEEVRIFESESIAVGCTCSKERIEAVLRMMGRQEIEDLVQEQGEVKVDCEFCNGRYRFDAVDIGALFADELSRVQPTESRH